MMNSPPLLPKDTPPSDRARAVASVPTVRIDQRYAPTVRMRIPGHSPFLTALRAQSKLLGCTLFALAALLLWILPRFSSARSALQPTAGTAEVLDLSISGAGLAAAGSSAHAEKADPVVAALPTDGLRAEAASLQPALRRKTPRRDVVRRALHAATPEVAACLSSQTPVRVRVTFVGASGNAVHAKVLRGVPPQASACIARAVKQVRVPAFGRRRFVIEHTFAP